MRNALPIFLAVLVLGCATSSQDKLQPHTGLSAIAPGELRVNIHPPAAELYWTGEPVALEVEGVASAIGGVRFIDIMLVLDRSKSLNSTDPDDYRSAAAIGFVESLSPKSDTLIGVVGFDSKSELLQRLTPNRNNVVRAVQGMKRSGGTNLAAGILTAVTELQAQARPGSSRLIMLFTDGKSNQRKAREATRQAQAQGVTVHTLLLGSSKAGASILDEIAMGTDGTFVQVTDPSELPEAFLNLRTTGVEQVTLSVNGSQPLAAQLAGGGFAGSVPLQLGENRVVARATSLDDQTRESVVMVNVRDASCAVVDVTASYEGLPAMSLNERAVEIVIDASRSMWGRMNGEPKMSVAKDTLLGAVDWLPQDLDLAFRAYGSASASDANDCVDSTLLVPFGVDERAAFRDAISELKPKGQSPIAFALQRAAEDFAGLESERTVVLVTDGIESCGGDPVAAASELAQQGLTIHVIGFGMENAADEDTVSLQAIAHAGGGQFLTAASAVELKQALEATVGTQYRVLQGATVVGQSVLGADEQFFLPEGDYRLELDSVPPREVQFDLAPRDQLTLRLEKTSGVFSHTEERHQLAPASCEEAIAWKRSSGDEELTVTSAAAGDTVDAGRSDLGWFFSGQ